MKRINLLLALAAMVLSFGLSSCDKDNQQNTKAENLKFEMGYDLGNVYNHYSNVVRMYFTTDSLTQTDDGFEGSGKYFVFEVCSEVDKDNYPKAGEYKVADLSYGEANSIVSMVENGAAVPFLSASGRLFGTYVVEIVDGEESAGYSVNEGSIKISGDASAANITATLKGFDDNNVTKDFSFAFKGAVEMESQPIDASSQFKTEKEEDVVDKTIEFNKVSCVNYGDYSKFGLNLLLLTMTSADGYECQFYLNAPLDVKQSFGTYTITHKLAPYTGDRSVGVDQEGYVIPPVIGIPDKDGQGLKSAWFIDGGTVVMNEDGVSFDVVSYYGSKFKGSYKGEVTISNAQNAPVQHMLAK